MCVVNARTLVADAAPTRTRAWVLSVLRTLVAAVNAANLQLAAEGATRLHGISKSRPRRCRDLSPRNIHATVAVAASPSPERPELSASLPRRRRDPRPRNIRVAAAAAPRPRLRGISTSLPWRCRDPSARSTRGVAATPDPSPRNIYILRARRRRLKSREPQIPQRHADNRRRGVDVQRVAHGGPRRLPRHTARRERERLWKPEQIRDLLRRKVPEPRRSPAPVVAERPRFRRRSREAQLFEARGVGLRASSRPHGNIHVVWPRRRRRDPSAESSRSTGAALGARHEDRRKLVFKGVGMMLPSSS